VKRAYWCGEDTITGNNCVPRKAWLDKRLLELASIFSVGLYAYLLTLLRQSLANNEQILMFEMWLVIIMPTT